MRRENRVFLDYSKVNFIERRETIQGLIMKDTPMVISVLKRVEAILSPPWQGVRFV